MSTRPSRLRSAKAMPLVPSMMSVKPGTWTHSKSCPVPAASRTASESGSCLSTGRPLTGGGAGEADLSAVVAAVESGRCRLATYRRNSSTVTAPSLSASAAVKAAASATSSRVILPSPFLSTCLNRSMRPPTPARGCVCAEATRQARIVERLTSVMMVFLVFPFGLPPKSQWRNMLHPKGCNRVQLANRKQFPQFALLVKHWQTVLGHDKYQR